MAETINWKELVLVKGDGTGAKPEVALKGKLVGAYFSAHWCGPCRKFTPKLKEFYDAVKKTENFEIVFISRDNSAEEMKAYIKESHGDWLHTSFDQAKANALFKKYGSGGIPALIIFDEKGERMPIEGYDEILTWAMSPQPKDVFAAWRTKTGGATINWKEFVLAKRDGTRVPSEVALKGKLVGLYISARGCQDIGLKQFYEALKTTENFEVVYVSDDKSAAEMKANMEETQPDWLNIPYDKDIANNLLHKYAEGLIPALVLFDAKGNLLPVDGRKEVFQSAPPPKDIVAKWRTKRTAYYQ